MTHTDHDDEMWFWKDHFANHCTMWNRAQPQSCWCEHASYRGAWHPIPSWWRRSDWHRGERRAERSALRGQMRRARAGHFDWDDVPSGDRGVYRRGYFD